MPRHDEEGHGKWMNQYLLGHSDPAGTPSPDLWRQGMVDFAQLDVDASVLWTQIGPAPLVIEPGAQLYQGIGPDAGEVTDIRIDPAGATDNIIYIATNDGGVWKTDDGGVTWTQTMDDLLSLSMGAIAIDASSPPASRVIYAGTGNMYDGGRAFTKGIGIYRSADGGLTWNIVDGGPFATIFANKSILDMEVIAADTLLVATDSGLYRSVDGGQNFGANDPAYDDRRPVLAGLITCILPDAANPANNIYACVSGRGVLRSTDGGKTFPTNLFGAANGAPAQPFNNIQLAQSEQNPQVLYASVQVNNGNTAAYKGLYQSMNGGTNWSVLNGIVGVASGDGFKQTDYDLTLGIDPQIAVTNAPNAGQIYVGFQELWRSSDGGRNFQSPACTSSQVHWDNHVLCFSPPGHRPTSPTTIYVGTDGGIAKSSDGGQNWTAINGDIGSNLLRGIDIGRGSVANNVYTYGGMQDTGTAGHRPGDVGVADWHAGINGDGYLVAVDPVDPTIVYGFDDNEFIKTVDGGANWDESDVPNPKVGKGLPNPDTDFTRAVAVDQVGADKTKRVVYVSVLKTLYKSTDSGIQFTPCNLVTGRNIRCIATTKADINRVWVAAADGTVHYSADAGASWDTGSFQSRPGGIGPATGIAIDPAHVDRVAVVFSGLSNINSKYRTKRVFRTDDSGATWYDVSGTDGNGPLGNLPDLPMHSVAFDTSSSPSALIVASDAGVMRSTDVTVTGGSVSATWKLYGVGLPTVSCSSLAIDNTVSPPLLRVGTYGRSCFEVTRPTGPRLYCSPSPGFGPVPTGSQGTLPIYVYNCGDAPLNITNINIVGSANFQFDSPPAYPVVIAPGGNHTFNLVFTPAGAGEDRALLAITSNDASSPYALSATGRGVAAGKPRLATNPVAKSGFGDTTSATDRTLTVQVFNVGTKELTITGIDRSGSSDISLSPAPTFPLKLAPGAESDVTFKYHPSGDGQASSVFQFSSDDPQSPSSLTLVGNGVGISNPVWVTVLEVIGVAVLLAGAGIGAAVLYDKLQPKK